MDRRVSTHARQANACQSLRKGNWGKTRAEFDASAGAVPFTTARGPS